MVRISAVADVALIIGAATLPANGAWAASGCNTALIAIAAKNTASGGQERQHGKSQQATFHIFIPSTNRQTARLGVRNRRVT